MDWVRSCYTSSMRLFRDRPDVLIPGRWQFCPPGAKAIPYLHPWASSNWDWEHRYPLDPPLGEVTHGSWFKGNTNPRYTGQNWCGTREVWENGAPYAARGTPAVDLDGVPFCCATRPAPPGGDADDGVTVQGLLIRPVLLSGGDADDGVAPQTPYVHLATGGDADDGTAGQSAMPGFLSSGGDSDDGLAVQLGPILIARPGGDAEDSSGPQTGAWLQVGEGGDGDGGTASQTGYNLLIAEGGDAEDGSAPLTGPWLILGTGGDSDDRSGLRGIYHGELSLEYSWWEAVMDTGVTFSLALETLVNQNGAYLFAGTGLLHLYQNNYTPVYNVTNLADLDEASYSGYAPHSITGTAAISHFAEYWIVSQGPTNFNSDSSWMGSQTIYGYYITGAAGQLLAAVRFDTSIAVNTPDFLFDLYVSLRIRNQP